MIQSARPTRRHGWTFFAATALLLLAAFFRLWHLSTAPSGIQAEELVNVQLSQELRHGHVSVIYEEAQPAREGLYLAVLAGSTAITGEGLILWRLPSVWLSMLFLAAAFSLMRRLFGGPIALLTLALLAVSFWSLWVSRAILHITLMPLVTVLVMYTLLRAYQFEEINDASLWFTIAGLLIGIAQYIHVTAWALIVIFIAVAIYHRVMDREVFRDHWENVIYSMSLVAALSLPLMLFLIKHPGARQPVHSLQAAEWLAAIPQSILSTITSLAWRGDASPFHNIPGRPAMSLPIGLLMGIGIGVALFRWRRPAYALILVWLGAGLLAAGMLSTEPDFEMMALLLPVIFLFPAMGLSALVDGMRQVVSGAAQQAAIRAMLAVTTLLLVGITVRTYQDFFQVWPALADVQDGYQSELGVLAHYLDAGHDPTPISICSTPVDQTPNAFALSNQGMFQILMHRQDVPIRYFDCTHSLVLANGGESQRLIFPRGHYYEALPGPLLAWMRYAHDERIAGIGPDVLMRIDAQQPLADKAGSFITTAPTAWPPEAGGTLASLPVPFATNVTFLGYVIRDDTITATDWVEMTTYWRLDGPPPSELTMFAHLLGNPVVVIAQEDNLAVQIGTLHPRDVFLEYSMIQTPGSMAAGLYPLSVGLYLPSTGQRLPAYENGQRRADRIFLQRIQITP